MHCRARIIECKTNLDPRSNYRLCTFFDVQGMMALKHTHCSCCRYTTSAPFCGFTLFETVRDGQKNVPPWAVGKYTNKEQTTTKSLGS